MYTKKQEYHFPETRKERNRLSPVIVGSYPAGLFCAWYLAYAGYYPLILERGEEAIKRQKTVEHFWKNGVLDPDSNVQFGEGGAGTFSDGKLNTLVKDSSGRNREVLKRFVEAGAPGKSFISRSLILAQMFLSILSRHCAARLRKWEENFVSAPN